MQDRLDRALYRGPIAWMARNGVAANLLMVALLLGGIVTAFQIKQEVFPEFDLDQVSVQVAYPGASPEEVEQGILLVIEEQVRSLEGVKRVTSRAAEGSGGVVIELELGVDKNVALADVKSAIDRITSFPGEAEEPEVSLVARKREVIEVAVFGDVGEQALREVAENVKDRLLISPSITYIELYGTRDREIAIELRQEDLRRYGLTLPQIATAIGSQALDLPAGGIDTDSGEILVRTTERRDYGYEFEDVPILTTEDGGEVTLGMIANVKDTFEDTDREARFDGKPAVLVNVYRSGDQTPIEVADIVHELVAQAETQQIVPEGIQLAVLNDQSRMYRDRIDLLLRNAYTGLALVMLVLGLFLSVRLAFWVTMGIPISFLGSMTLLPGMDVSINMISLFAFIVTLGIVVDDAIVVGENVYEMRQRGMGRMSASIAGAQQIASPVIFSVLTTVAAFSPLLMVPGTMGKLFRNIPVVVISVLILSLVESLFVLPAHLGHRPRVGPALWRFFAWPFSPSARKPLPHPGEDDPDPPPSQITVWLETPQKYVSRGLEWLIERTYVPTARVALEHRYFTLAVGVATTMLVVGVVMSGRVAWSFFPKMDSDRIKAALTLPYGSPVEATEELRNRLLQAARDTVTELEADDAIEGIFDIVGSGAGPDASTGSHVASVQVFLAPSDQRDFGAAAFADAWREQVGEMVGIESLTFTYSMGPGSSSAIEVYLIHDDIPVLEEAAEKLAAELATFDGIKDIDDGFSNGKPQLDFTLSDLGRSLGLTASSMASQIRGSFYGAEALRQQRGRDEVKVMVRLAEDERSSERDIETLMIRTADGGEVPLLDVADVTRGHAYTSITRADGRRVVSVTADIVPGVGNAQKVLASLKANYLPKLMADTAGLSFSFEGQRRDQSESMGALQIGFPLALLAIYTLLAIPFGSYLQPIVVMSAIPFGVVGAVAGHFFLGYDLSFVSVMGIVAASGIVVNDSLVLVHAANAYRAEGATAFQAMILAGSRRFRPILLTSLTTFLGLAPMILETSLQARFIVPMAISLGFGVMFSTAVILVLVPALYLILEDVVRLFLGMPEDVVDTLPPPEGEMKNTLA